MNIKSVKFDTSRENEIEIHPKAKKEIFCFLQTLRLPLKKKEFNLFNVFGGKSKSNDLFCEMEKAGKNHEENSVDLNKTVDKITPKNNQNHHSFLNDAVTSENTIIVLSQEKNETFETNQEIKSHDLESQRKKPKSNHFNVSILGNLKIFLINFFQSIPIQKIPDFNKYEWLILDSLLKRKIGKGLPKK